MITQHIKIGDNKWNILIYYNVTLDTIDEVIQSLNKLGCSEKYIKKTLRVLRDKNTGFTFTNSRHKTSVVCLSEATSVGEFISTTIHELRHLQQHICDYYNVPEEGETPAYLIGYIAKRMYKALLKALIEYV